MNAPEIDVMLRHKRDEHERTVRRLRQAAEIRAARPGLNTRVEHFIQPFKLHLPRWLRRATSPKPEMW